MLPVQAHLVLNHVPLVGLVFGLIFAVLGGRRSPEFYLAALRIFLSIGVLTIPVVLSGLHSADLLSGASWLDAAGIAEHRRAGLMTLAVPIGLVGVQWNNSFQT